MMNNDPKNAMQSMLAEMKEDDRLTDNQVDDLHARFSDVYSDVCDWGDCDHDDVRAIVPPRMIEREGADVLSQTMETGTITVLHGECHDCGAPVDVSLELTANTAASQTNE